MELACIADTYLRLKSSAAYRRNLLENYAKTESTLGLTWKPPMRGVLLHYVHVPVWRVLLADQEFSHALEHHEKEIRLGMIARSNSWILLREEAAKLGRTNDTALSFGFNERMSLYDRFRYLFSNAPSVVRGSYILRAFQSETEARLAATAVALQRYKVMGGSYPTNLEELIPNFLNSVPIDPMDGKKLKYSRLGTDYLLYSVGLNGRDDSGTAGRSSAKSAKSIWDADDAIWPALRSD